MRGLRFFNTALVPIKENLMATAYNDMLDNKVLPSLWLQFGEGPSLFQHDSSPENSVRSIKKLISQFGVDELTGLQRALTSAPSNTFGINSNADCEPGYRPTSVAPLTNAPVAGCQQTPAAKFQNLVKRLSGRLLYNSSI